MDNGNNGIPRPEADALSDAFEGLDEKEAAGSLGGTVSESPMEEGVKRMTPPGVRPKNNKEVMDSLNLTYEPVPSYSIDVSKLKTLKDVREFITSLDVVFHKPADCMLKFLKEK